MIRFEAVSKVFAGKDGREVVAVRDVDLEVAEGETLCLIGTSGCGKTTTLKMVNRLVEPTSGRVLVGEQDVAGLDVIALRRGIGYVIQSGGLFPHMTVGENVSLLCRLERWDGARTAARVDELLELVNLPVSRFRDRMPAELSGGQRQRVGVARALALDPPILLMDEPFGALDPITRREVRQEFRSLEDKVSKTVILVTHDLPEAFDLGDRVALMHVGSVVQVDTPENLRNRPANGFVESFLDAQEVG